MTHKSKDRLDPKYITAIGPNPLPEMREDELETVVGGVDGGAVGAAQQSITEPSAVSGIVDLAAQKKGAPSQTIEATQDTIFGNNLAVDTMDGLNRTVVFDGLQRS